MDQETDRRAREEAVLERATAEDRVASYALVDYAPLAPVEGKLRPGSLLDRYWEEVGTGSAMRPVRQALRDEFGLHGSAWGIKQSPEGLSSELYWYFHGDRRPLTVDRVSRALASGGLRVDPPADDGRSWYSLSVDVPATGAVRDFHTYLTHAPAQPRTSVSYHLGADGLRMENVYYLFDPATELDALRTYLEASPPTTGLSSEVLWDRLLPCDHVAFAHKPRGDGLYYGGVDVDQLLWFLRRVDMAAWLTSFVADHRDDLDYLRFDVGFDYVDRDGTIEVVKCGVYGVV